MTRSTRTLTAGALGASALALVVAAPAAAAPPSPGLQPINSVAESFEAPKRLVAARAAERAAQRPESQASILVKLRDDSKEATDAFAAKHDLTIVRRLPQIDWVELKAGSRVEGLLDSLRSDPEVISTDAVAEGERFGPEFTPRDPIFSQPGNLSNGAPYAWHLSKINLPAAWDITRGSSATAIGVIDSEFDTQNPDLTSKLKTGYNTKSGSPEYHTSAVRMTDAEGQQNGCAAVHGTHVAGTIAAATDNNKGTTGVSFDNLVMPIRSSFNFTSGSGATDAQFVADATEAILYASDKGLVAINMSFGTARPHDPLRDAIAVAVSRGVTMVASAGNDQETQAGVTNYPGAYPGVIAVAATKSNDDVASFSRSGDYVDIAAPGDVVLSTWESRCQPGEGGQFGAAPGDGVNLNAISGTSMASPIVAGVVGLMKSVRPDLNPAEVEQLLTSTARDLGAGGRDPAFGAGLVDANRAVAAAQAFTRPAPPAPPAPPVVVTPVAPPVVVTPPAPKLKVLRAIGKASYNKKLGRIALRVECAIDCKSRIRLKALDRTFKFRTTKRGKRRSSLSFSLKAGKRKTLKLYVSKKDMRRYAKVAGKSRKVSVKITITGQGTGAQSGLKRTTRPTLTVKKP